MEHNRIYWIDIYRGILIVLMVIGHSTGLFNGYIYQFHMAAFFFLSGYLAQPQRKGFLQILYEKFCTILLPFISSAVFGMIVLYVVQLINQNVMVSIADFCAWAKTIKEFFYAGNLSVDVLGATWFLGILFGVCVLNKIQYILLGKSKSAFALFAILLYIIGYEFVRMQIRIHIGILYLDLIFIGQMFYNIGYLIKQSNLFNLIKNSKKVVAFLMSISIICIWSIEKYLHIVVDWPSRSFNNFVLDGWCALNGIFMIFAVSVLIERKFTIVRKILVYIGKNTVGILLLHFCFFKVQFNLFYIAGIISEADRVCLTPGMMSTDILATKYWWLISTCSIILSLITWNILLRVHIIRFLLGCDKQTYAKIWSFVLESRLYKHFLSFNKKFTEKVTLVRRFIYEEFNKHKIICTSCLLLLLFIAIPWYKQAIMCNDELQSRLWSMKGFSEFYNHYLSDHIEKGRGLSTGIVSLTMYLGFLGSSNWTFKILQILSIWIDVALFAILLYKLYGKKFAILCGLSIIMFLPITFEHVAPNAFNTLYNIPFAFLMVSLILFKNYLENGKKRQLVCSMILLFINLLSYESFLMLLPVYYGLAVGKSGLKNMKQLLRQCIYPTMTASIFLICYMLSRTLFPSTYLGNQVGIISLNKSFTIVKQLVAASCPGYWLFPLKYRYLAQIYSNLRVENIFRIVLITVIFGGMCYYLMKSENKVRISNYKFGVSLVIGILCVILPVLPISVAQMYQNSVEDHDFMFMALPTTYFCYYATTFVCWWIIWWIINKIKSSDLIVFIVVGVILYMIPVQTMNDIFAEQQNQDFKRLTTMESLFSTELFTQLRGKEFLSDDFFVTRNTLAIHDSYWSEYANMKGMDIKILNGEGSENDNRIFFDNNNFSVWIGNNACLITTELNEEYCLKCAEGVYKSVSGQNPIRDNGFYEYYYTLLDTDEVVLSDRQEFLNGTVGNTLEDCLILDGYYSDGWVASHSSFLIKTGDDGVIDIQLYCPLEDFSNSEVSIYLDGILIDVVKVESMEQNISVISEPNRQINLSLSANFIQTNTGADMRELSMIIKSLQGR